MNRLTAGAFSSWSGGELHGQPHHALGRPSIDTRTLQQDDCFFALVGPHFNGHDFVSDALSAGARTLVVDRKYGGTARERASGFEVNVIEVDCTEVALQRLGIWFRDQFKGTVCGITGSSGKTTTKEMMRTALSVHGGVVATRGNLNNHLGVPLSLAQLHEDADFGIFEMGMNAPNEIRTLSAWVRPKIGVITSIGEAHLEGVGSLEGVAKAKGELFETLGAQGFAVFPDDVPYADYLMSIAGNRLRGVGLRDTSFCRILDVQAHPEGSLAKFAIDGHSLTLELPCIGLHQVQNALCVLTTVHLMGLDLRPSIEALSRFRMPSMRGERHQLSDGSTVIVDCYNANPQSMRAAISAQLLTHSGPFVLVLGDMLELGAQATQAHRDLGTFIARSGRDVIVIGVGPLMEFTIQAARDEGVASQHLYWFATAEEAGQCLIDQRPTQTHILIKGSRGVRLETVWNRLKGLGQDQ